MIISAVYLVVRCLLGCLMMLTRHQVSKDAELLVLRHEILVLRRQIGPVRYQPCDRLWLAALSRLVPRRQWGEVFAVTPATLLAWHRQLVTREWDHTSRRHPGRPFTAAAIRKLVILCRARIPRGGTGGCKVNSSSWDIRSPLPRCGRSCMTPGSAPRPPQRPDLEAVPDRASPRHPRCRLRPRGHRAPAAHLCPDRHRASHPPRSSDRHHRAAGWRVDNPGGA